MTITHRTVQTNGINMHIAEAGEGPLVIMCHGWPESWYSWRHQLQALGEAGFRAVAPDQRGYGQTDKPEAIDQYTQFHMIGDVIGLMDALGEETAVIAGHDWGAPIAWNTALLRPDRIRAVIGLSVPYMPRASTAKPAAGDAMGWGGPVRPTDAMRAAFGDFFFYQLYFQTPGVAEHELQKDVKRSLRLTLVGASGDAPVRAPMPLPSSAGFLDQMEEPKELPAWLSEADLDYFTKEFQGAGFRGGLNWYRNIDRNWELTAAFAGAKITQPALFMAGDRDVVVAMAGAAINDLEESVPNLRKKVMLPGCGHWTQQERAKEVNEEMLAFLRGL